MKITRFHINTRKIIPRNKLLEVLLSFCSLRIECRNFLLWDCIDPQEKLIRCYFWMELESTLLSYYFPLSKFEQWFENTCSNPGFGWAEHNMVHISIILFSDQCELRIITIYYCECWINIPFFKFRHMCLSDLNGLAPCHRHG